MLGPEPLTHIDVSEEDEDGQRNDLLQCLQLVCCEGVIPNTIRGHLQAVFEEGDAPTSHHHQPERQVHEPEMAVPCNRHKDIRKNEQGYRLQKSHVVPLPELCLGPSRL